MLAALSYHTDLPQPELSIIINNNDSHFHNTVSHQQRVSTLYFTRSAAPLPPIYTLNLKNNNYSHNVV